MTDQQLALTIIGLAFAASILATVCGLAWRRPRALQGFVDSVDYASDIMGRGVAWFALVLVVLQFIVICARSMATVEWLQVSEDHIFHFFLNAIQRAVDFVNHYLIAFQDAIAWAYAFIFLLGASYTLRHDDHVRVDIIYGRLAPKGKAVVNIVGTLILLFPMCGAFLWFLWGDLLTSWRTNEASRETGGLPAVYVVKTAVVVMVVQLMVQGFSMLCASMLTLAGHRELIEPEQHGEGL